jgi:hypothetical protein
MSLDVVTVRAIIAHRRDGVLVDAGDDFQTTEADARDLVAMGYAVRVMSAQPRPGLAPRAGQYATRPVKPKETG